MNELQSITDSIMEAMTQKQLEVIQHNLIELKGKIMQTDETIDNSLIETFTLLRRKNELIEEQNRTHFFIIDTTVIMEDPEIILRVDKKHTVIIPSIVREELERIKSDSILFPVVKLAVKLIQQDKNRNIRHIKTRMKHLPPEFKDKTPENLVLSVALQYKKNDGILITSNSLLYKTAKESFDLNVMSLIDFKTKFDLNQKN